MRKERNKRPSRKMNPVYIVFCEGETEKAYINFLRKQFREKPIKIISHVIPLSPRNIKNHISHDQIGRGDKIKSFLMYDLDIKSNMDKIIACKDSIPITSNPTVELWFLLHICEQNAAISTDECFKKLEKSSPEWAHYKKGNLSDKQEKLLWDNLTLATARAKKLAEWENPSSLVYRLIEA